MRLLLLADLHMKSLHRELLLLHEWHVAPPHIRNHHTLADFQLGPTRVLALSIISVKELIHRHGICPGWGVLFQWDGEGLQFLQAWP